MTRNQIAYWELQESKRANLAKEAELNRSNLAKEEETKRSNLAKETEKVRSNRAEETLRHTGLVETARANKAKETETHRSNVAREEQAVNDMTVKMLGPLALIPGTKVSDAVWKGSTVEGLHELLSQTTGYAGSGLEPIVDGVNALLGKGANASEGLPETWNDVVNWWNREMAKITDPASVAADDAKTKFALQEVFRDYNSTKRKAPGSGYLTRSQSFK